MYLTENGNKIKDKGLNNEVYFFSVFPHFDDDTTGLSASAFLCTNRNLDDIDNEGQKMYLAVVCFLFLKFLLPISDVGVNICMG
jgi:hypothetical protein